MFMHVGEVLFVPPTEVLSLSSDTKNTSTAQGSFSCPWSRATQGQTGLWSMARWPVLAVCSWFTCHDAFVESLGRFCWMLDKFAVHIRPWLQLHLCVWRWLLTIMPPRGGAGGFWFFVSYISFLLKVHVWFVALDISCVDVFGWCRW